MTAGEVAALIGTGVLLAISAAVTVAGRSLSRLQRREWASGTLADEVDEVGSSAVEIAFVSMGVARQLLLVGLSVQIAVHGVRHAWQPWLVAPLVVTIAAYLIVDKLLPYWLVALVGSDRVLRAGAPWSRLVRLVFGPSRPISRVRLTAPELATWPTRMMRSATTWGHSWTWRKKRVWSASPRKRYCVAWPTSMRQLSAR